jgi:Kef-type K+ transport system membrane component KefB
MNRIKNLLFYTSVIVVFSILIYWIAISGKHLESGKNVQVIENAGTYWSLFKEAFHLNSIHPLALLLIQIVTIILASRLFGWFCKKIGQPEVIGEIAAGIALGPSLAGTCLPEVTAFLFPPQSLNNLFVLSQIGLILFMFVIGMELDLKVLKKQAHEAVVVSHASIIIPFALGTGLAYFIYETFAPQGVQFVSFSLFMGISMSITAFPVLARIVQERGIHKTKVGAMVITCAAVDDISAWSMLAAVIAIVKAGSFISSLPTILIAIAYVMVMLYVVKPFLKRVSDLHASRESMSKPVIAIFFLALLLSSYATEIIGIHALFGAFMAGTVMSDNLKFKQIFIEKIEDVALVLLLPLFFVYTGLRTQIGLLNDFYLWQICGAIVLVAIVGKFIGSALAAKFVGQNWHDSLIIGALMNTRGLVELVALNIGYDLGVITPEIFSMLVIMALFTTFMTAPALDLIERIFKGRGYVLPEAVEVRKYKVLISFGKPEMGSVLLKLLSTLVKNTSHNTLIDTIHLFPGNLFNKFKIDNYEHDSFNPIEAESRRLKLGINKIFKVSEDIDTDIVTEANSGNYDLLLIGMGQSIFQGSMLGRLLGYTTSIFNPNWLLDKIKGKEKFFTHSPMDDRTRQILANTQLSVGILINKGLHRIDKVLLLLLEKGDAFLIDFAGKLIRNAKAQVTIVDPERIAKEDSIIKETIHSNEQIDPDVNRFMLTDSMSNIDLQQFDLVMISLEGWKKWTVAKGDWIKNTPSAFIIRPDLRDSN